MRWFRSKLHLGSRLALLALVVQMLLSFGHVHAPRPMSVSVASAGIAGSDARLLNAPDTSGDPDSALDADCPICALIQLVASSAPPAAPALPLPPRPGSIRLPAPVDVAFASSPPVSFQARAPPLS